MNKAFKIPLLKRTSIVTSSSNDESSEVRPSKKPRLDSRGSEDCSHNGDSLAVASDPRNPLQRVDNRQKPSNIASNADGGASTWYTVLWRKFTTKKHKTWDGDGVLVISGGYATLQDDSGKDLGRAKFGSPLLPGSTLSVAGKDVEVETIISKADYLSRTPATKPAKTSALPVSCSKPLSKTSNASNRQKNVNEGVARPPNPAAPRSAAARKGFKAPLLSDSVQKRPIGSKLVPRHDPTRPGAVVLKRPHQAPDGKQVVDVVLDPVLSDKLRVHQREGVAFMYECVMGLRPFTGQGAILADDMGLGKTLQTITLLWTLLKQNPIYDEPPLIKKALVVCPASVVNNWRKEFRKWLGPERIGVFMVDDKKTNIRDFTMGKSYSIMVVGYEKFCSIAEELQRGTGIDIIIADEGHRIKTIQNKAGQAIKSFDTDRRIILSGTPVQNNLSEFWVAADLVNPGLLGTYNSFKRKFEIPILKGKEPGASPKDVKKGKLMSEELNEITNLFMLRRSADVLAQYLPPKTESVLFCRPTTAQADVYRSILSSSLFGNVLGSPEASLQLILALRKACNSPTLLSPKVKEDRPSNKNVAALLSDVPMQSINSSPVQSSTKLRVLGRLLHHLRSKTQEKIVLVSNFTSTLDLLQTYLSAQDLPFLRLDGSTPQSKRQDLIDDFNRLPVNRCFAFLLSATAGGVGINLIGASRLVLFDVHWNPSTDAQAMARIHRDGQKRPVKIYRLMVSGAIDEKIWQRQVTKMGLADSVMDHKKDSSASFSTEELKDLFNLDTQSICQTHDLIECRCEGKGLASPVSLSEDGELPRGEETLELEDSDDDKSLPEMGSLVRASQVDMDAQELRIKDRKRSGKRSAKGMQLLMRYSHIDTTNLSGSRTPEADADLQAAIDDDILMEVLNEEDNRVNFVFSKSSA
ncbi:MAG: hypothetical protein M4579_005101 [Chaenotheca gracillima]|nr:MAG: hypothetical protein M4579_005101 [Chaenotheca gracillima]